MRMRLAYIRMTIRREIAALLAGWNTKGIVKWARRHVVQSRAHPLSCYLAAPVPLVALGALVAAAAGAVSFAAAG